MITFGSKFFYALAGVLVVAAVVYGYTTGGGEVGPISAGYKGGVGDHIGYGILLGAAAVAAFLGAASSAFRDADQDDQDVPAAGDAPVPSSGPVAPSYWPILGAFGVGLVAIGVVLNAAFFIAGLILIGAVAIEWTMQAWAERATGDPAVNREIRNRIMLPLEVPIGGTAIIAVVILGYSRVFLNISQENAVWAALAVAAIVFGGGAILAARPQIRRDVVAGLLTAGAVITIGLAVYTAIDGERDIQPHHDHDEDVHEEGAAATLEESN